MPTDPAERITSFLAETVVGAPPRYQNVSNIFMHDKFCYFTSWCGTGSRGICELHASERRDTIFSTGLNELQHGGVDQDGKIGTGIRRGKVTCRRAASNTSSSRRLKPADSEKTVVAATHILVVGVL